MDGKKKKSSRSFYTLPRRSHGVQNGLSGVLDVLGLRQSKSFDSQEPRHGEGSDQPTPAPSQSSLLSTVSYPAPPSRAGSGSFMTTPSAAEELPKSTSPATLSQVPTMPIIDHFRKSRSKGTNGRDSSVTPTSREPTPVSVTKRLTSPSGQAGDLSIVQSSRTSTTSSSISSNETATETPAATAPPSRNITPAKEVTEIQSLIVQDAFSLLETRLRAELAFSREEALANGLSIEDFLSYISNERLRRMPANGSRWDSILKWAETFASALSFFEERVSAFVVKSKQAVSTIYGCLRVLLQLGPSQGIALERAFTIFSHFETTFTFYVRNFGALSLIARAQEELSLALADTLTLVIEVTVTYHKSMRTMSASSVAVDFDTCFASHVNSFVQRKDHITNLMWTYHLQQNEETSCVRSSIEQVRSWLMPQDTPLISASFGASGSSAARAEGTCQWFERSLVAFLRSQDRIFTVSGESGVGKSVLFGWISERLRRPVERKAYQSIVYQINSQIASQSTQSAMVKSFLLQLLDQNVGNIALYKCLANTLELDNNTNNPEDVEDAFWNALDTALAPCSDVVLVLDGLDALQPDEPHQLKAFEKLYETASKHNNVRIIILTRPLSVAFSKPIRKAIIDSTQTTKDVKSLTRAHLHAQGICDEQQIEELSEEMAQRSAGSLTWAQMAMQYFKGQNTTKEMLATVQKIPATTEEVIQKQLSELPANSVASLILSWMLVARRPLTLVEIQYLTELDIHKGTYQPRSTNLTEEIQKSLGSLVVIQGKTLYFKNDSIRQHLLAVSKEGSTLLTPTEASGNMCTKLLLYNKVCVTRSTEPGLEPLNQQDVQALYRSNPLLEYSARNWAAHFKLSPFFAKGEIQPFTSELKNAFPTSALLARLEQSSLDKQTSATDASNLLVLALSARRAALGDSNASVLQSSINVAKSQEKLSLTGAASIYFHRAFVLAQGLCGRDNNLTYACAAALVDNGDATSKGARNEETGRREETLKYLIQAEKQRSGTSDSSAGKYSNLLAQLYVDAGENDKAKDVYQAIYESGVEEHGEFSREAAVAGDKLGTLLFKEGKHSDVIKYQQRLFESAEKSLSIFDVRRVEITLRMAQAYEENKEFVAVEELYIELWRGLGDYTREHNDSQEAHERKIQVTIAYAKFLRSQNRQAEAECLLHGVWIAYQYHEPKSEALVFQLKLVADELTSMGILDTAVNLLKSICGWFKSSGKQATTESVSTATALVDAVQKNATKKHDVKVARAAATGCIVEENIEDERDIEAELIMEEVSEAVVAAVAPAGKIVSAAKGKSETTEVSALLLATCEKLSLFYVSKQQWVQAIGICQRVLTQLWPTLGQADAESAFPKTQTTESIRFARRLALCYTEAGQSEQAEKIYNHLFVSAKSSLRIQDSLITETSNDLVGIYQNTKQYSKALVVYQQLLDSYRTGVGARHALTLQTLNIMGDFCTKYQLKGADVYYLEIAKSSTDKEGIISQESIRTFVRLSKIYHDQKRWAEAATLYKSLFLTYSKRGKDYGISSEALQTSYTRYRSVLTAQNADFETTRLLAVHYRDVSQSVFGADSQVAAEANVQLAEVYAGSESKEHHAEAVKITGNVIATISQLSAKVKTTQQLDILAKAKRSLASLYTSHVAVASTPETAAQAVALWTEQFESNKKEFGISHKATLESLASLTAMNLKSDNIEVQTAAKSQLQSSVVDILVTEKESSKLFDSASALATVYVSSNLTTEAWNVLRLLRYQIISEKIKVNDKATALLPATVDRRAFVFIASFETTLCNSGATKVAFSDVMTDLLTESILFDRYYLSIRQKDLAVSRKLFDGARLHAFLSRKTLHTEQLAVLETQMTLLFTKSLGAGIKTSTETSRRFFVAVIQELSQHQADADVLVIGCQVGTQLVHELLEAEKFAEAFETATCVYQFLTWNKGFSVAGNMASTFKLSLFLVGLGAKKSADTALAAKMVELSTAVLRETLASCRSLQVDLVQLQAADLDNLVRLMGEQNNYTDLEWLLTQLWSSRELQATWSAATIISIGRRLVEVLFMRKQDAAIDLCESIAYNLRRTWGLLDSVTIDVYNLLSSLYVTVGRNDDALALHCEILRTDLADDPDEQMAEEIASEVMLNQIALIKKLYARNGGWGDDGLEVETVTQIINEFKSEAAWSGVESVEQWSTEVPDASDIFGTFAAPTNWDFVAVENTKKPDYFPRWLKLNRQLSLGELAFKADSKAKSEKQGP